MPTLCRDCLSRVACAGRRCAACGSPRLLQHDELDALAIAHLDCDAFYASVEKRDRPELRDLPVIVGGGVRGVVTTACYIARTFGVRSAMPMFKARKLCPDAVIVRPDFAKYVAESRRIMAKLQALTPLVQPLSLDEAWVDLSGTEALNGGPPAWQLARVQAEIEREIGIGVSVGLAPNKVLAKIASDLDKPRGFAVIGAAEAVAFLAPRPVRLLPGVGPAFERALAKAGLHTIGDVARSDPRALERRFGEGGPRLHRLAHGQDARAVNPESERKGVSAETTFNTDLTRLEELEDRLWTACEKVARRAREAGVAGRVATLKLKTANFRLITRRRTLPAPVQSAKGLFAVVRALLATEADGRTAYRLIGAGIAELVEVEVDAATAAADLFATPDAGEDRARRADSAVAALRARFGDHSVLAGRSFKGRGAPGGSNP